MENDRKSGLKDPFEDDELDDAVSAADDTGMIAEQREIVAEQIAQAQEEEPPEGG
ncbi:MAG TPA: hypothetical protein VGZ02_08480 [Candidatus Baltobacteraceae bacterium]|jgi:hypothetical protein|nr:hypothetical protein [Candidatus Baltobacteraceae bacterium]